MDKKVKLDQLAFSVTIVACCFALIFGGIARADASKCERLKPEHKISQEKRQAIKGALSGTKALLGKIGINLEKSKSEKTVFQTLSQDNLAKQWFIYDACVLKDAGMLDDASVKKIMAKLFGIDGSGSSSSSSASAVPTIDNPNSLPPLEWGTLASPEEKEKVMAYFNQCKNSNAKSCAQLAYKLEKGETVSLDLKLSFGLYQFACNNDSPAGCAGVGFMYELGKGVNKDISKGISHHNKACKAGSARGCNNLGYAYIHGLGVRKDCKLGIQLYEKACNQEDTGDFSRGDGCFNMGSYFQLGSIPTKDSIPLCSGAWGARSESTAQSYFKKACTLGVADACKMLKK